MKSKLLIGSATLFAAGTIAWAAKDPVVMTVNGEDVPRSEFEYLYHKNSQQQLEAQPLEEYVGMFELYKMKVADAKAEGIDTTAAFLSEMAQYRRDLASPYVADSVYLNSLLDEAFEHSQEELEYSHIMFQKGRNAAENKATLLLADSVRQALIDGADFDELARKYSADRTAQMNGGHLGYMASGRLPYAFEHAAYSLAPGQVSEVVESNAGYHILKGGNRRPARGSVRAAHIMKMVRPGSTPEQEAIAKEQIDSLYQVVISNPASFEQVAMANSDDQGSARLGGQLGWFAAGQMVPEFSEMAFDTPVGAISEPVRTAYGWHIIKKIDAHGVPSREEIKPDLLKQMNDPRDERFKLIRNNRDRNLEKKHKAFYNPSSVDILTQYVAANGLDSAFYVTFNTNPQALYTIAGKPTSIGDFVSSTQEIIMPDSYLGSVILSDKLESEYDEALMNAEEDWLYANEADYRNLLNEYHDGSLLYEVSLRKVWDKAANDTQGLQKYFNAHKDEYAFKEPRAKGFLVLAKNDSVADAIKARFKELDSESALETLRQENRKVAVVDRLLAPQGLNRFVDKIMFGGPDPELNPNFPVYFVLDGRIITEPEEMNDVKGAVTADYQQLLEQNWTTELRQKYPVKRNDKELKKIK